MSDDGGDRGRTPTARRWFVASVVVLVAGVVVAALVSSARVPLHWDASGDPDRFGSRAEAALTVSLVGGALVVLFGGLARWMPRVPLELVNLPARQKAWWTATPERAAELRRRLADDVYVIGALTVGFVAVVALAGALAARRADQALGPVFLLATGAYLVVVLGWCGWLVRRRYRVPNCEDGDGRGGQDPPGFAG